MAMLRLEYDPEGDAAYIRLRPGSSARTEEVAPGLLVDFAEDGHPLGIELLDASAALGGSPSGVEFLLRTRRAAAAAGT